MKRLSILLLCFVANGLAMQRNTKHAKNKDITINFRAYNSEIGHPAKTFERIAKTCALAKKATTRVINQVSAQDFVQHLAGDQASGIYCLLEELGFNRRLLAIIKSEIAYRLINDKGFLEQSRKANTDFTTTAKVSPGATKTPTIKLCWPDWGIEHSAKMFEHLAGSFRTVATMTDLMQHATDNVKDETTAHDFVQTLSGEQAMQIYSTLVETKFDHTRLAIIDEAIAKRMHDDPIFREQSRQAAAAIDAANSGEQEPDAEPANSPKQESGEKT